MSITPSQRRQQGVALVLAIAVIASLALLGISGALKGRTATQGRVDDVELRFARAKAALVGHVAELGRLPCGANPALDTGTAVRVSGVCTFAQGSLPWATLGLRSDDGLDSWGNKISYRFYTGSAGSLAMDEGASMVLCNPSESQDAGPDGLCRSNKKTHPDNFLTVQVAGSPVKKGLVVTDFGVTREYVAYVLISHGPSGRGTYTTGGAATPAPTNASEIANTSASGPFVATVSSSSSMSPDSAAFFDDLVAYETTSELILKAGRGSRIWP